MGQTNNKAQAVKKPTAKRDYDNQFVNFDLNTVQLGECKAWVVSDSDLLLQIMALADDGYGISVQADERNHCYLSVMRARLGGRNAGFLLSGRGSTPAKAVKQVLFKHSVLDGDWGTQTVASTGIMDD